METERRGYFYEVYYELTNRRNHWHYLGRYQTQEIAYNCAVHRERTYFALTPPKRVARFQIVTKRYEEVVHTILYVRHAARLKETAFDSFAKLFR